MSDLIAEEVECCSCKRRSPTTVLYVDGKAWNFVPSGWFVADTYPPGDMGLVFSCSADCAVAYAATLACSPL